MNNGIQEQEVIKELMILENLKEESLSFKMAKLNKLSSMLTHESVANYVESHRKKLVQVGELVLTAMRETVLLNNEEVTGLALVSIILQGNPCLFIPKLFAKLS